MAERRGYSGGCMASDSRHFTDRQALRRPDDGGLISGDVPDRVRNAVVQYLGGAAGGFDYVQLCEIVVRRLDLDSHNVGGPHPDRDLRHFIRTCIWYEFLDVCEFIFDYAQTAEDSRLDANTFRTALNERLIRYYSAYRMGDNGRIREHGGTYREQAIEETRILLAQEKFSGAERQFRGALEDFNRRPDANFEGTVSNAINAVEGVARVVLKNEKISLSDALKQIQAERDLHGALVKSIDNLHGYASDAGGRHGLVGDPEVDRHIAEFCLHQSAAAILLIAQLYGFDVVRVEPG